MLAAPHEIVFPEHFSVWSTQAFIQEALINSCGREKLMFGWSHHWHIKKSLGLTRGKNDKIDSQRIAEYAYRFSIKQS